MTFKQALEEISKNPKVFSTYRQGLMGMIQIVKNKVVFRDASYKLKNYTKALAQADLLATDWQIAVRAE